MLIVRPAWIPDPEMSSASCVEYAIVEDFTLVAFHVAGDKDDQPEIGWAIFHGLGLPTLITKGTCSDIHGAKGVATAELWDVQRRRRRRARRRPLISPDTSGT